MHKTLSKKNANNYKFNILKIYLHTSDKCVNYTRSSCFFITSILLCIMLSFLFDYYYRWNELSKIIIKKKNTNNYYYNKLNIFKIYLHTHMAHMCAIYILLLASCWEQGRSGASSSRGNKKEFFRLLSCKLLCLFLISASLKSCFKQHTKI